MTLASNKNNSIWFHLIALIGMISIGLLVGQLVLKCIFTITGDMLQDFTRLKAKHKDLLLLSQGIIATSTFIVGPLLYWYIFEKKSIKYFFSGERNYLKFIILTVILTLAAMIVNTIFIDWNMHIKFPKWLKEFEKWAQQKEETLKVLTNFITNCKNPKDLFKTALVISIIPAISEELVFRGILQNLFIRGTKNIHIAILLSAFIFSTIHLQVYGFVPRFLLGVLFGYIYAWTKNLAFPITAHFSNNMFALLLLFFQQKKRIGLDLTDGQMVPLPIIILCATIGIYLGMYFRKKTQSNHI